MEVVPRTAPGEDQRNQLSTTSPFCTARQILHRTGNL
jgi:hypothetical protein